MKGRLVCLAMGLWACSICNLQGQQVKMVEIAFSMEQFLIADGEREGIGIEALEPGYVYSEHQNTPSFPLKILRVIVPPGSRLKSYQVEANEEVIREDFQPRYPSPVVPTKPVDGPEHPVSPEIQPPVSPGIFPDRLVEYGSVMIQRGYTWFSFLVSPFRYDSRNGTLSMASRIILHIEYKPESDDPPPVKYDRELVRSLQGNLANPEDLEEVYGKPESARLKSGSERVDYLIVTTDALKQAFAPLLLWKQRKGLSVDLVTMEEIDAIYKEPTRQLKIKRCLNDYYQKKDLRWVLLGGDAEVVPVQGCYSKIIMQQTELVDYSIPTDLFYGCFDKRFDWNSTVDDKIGQIYMDHLDLVPEVAIARAPVKDLKQAEIFVEKTLKYEKAPSLAGESGRILMSGVKSWNSWDGKSDNHHRSEYLFDRYIGKRWSNRKVGFFDSGTDFPEGNGYHVTSNNLSEQINKGFSILHFAGHGNNINLVMESGMAFNTEDAEDLTNKGTGIILTNACDVSAFDSIDPCLAESLLRNPDGGCVAFFGSARYGFGNPEKSTQLGPSMQFNALFLNHLFQEGTDTRMNTLGGITTRVKARFAETSKAGGTYQYLMYAINPMGDPEMQIYPGEPGIMNDVRIVQMSEALMVSTGDVDGATISVTSLDMEEGYRYVEEDVYSTTLRELPDAYQLTITAPGFIPYIYVSGTVHNPVEEMRDHVRIYPNPTDGMALVDTEFPAGILQLYDTSGRLLNAFDLQHGVNSLDLTDQSDGIYFIRISTGNASGWFRIVKYSR